VYKVAENWAWYKDVLRSDEHKDAYYVEITQAIKLFNVLCAVNLVDQVGRHCPVYLGHAYIDSDATEILITIQRAGSPVTSSFWLKHEKPEVFHRLMRMIASRLHAGGGLL
jgi:hypothetical protein